MTTLKDLCFHLSQCVEKIEGQVLVDMNDFENKITSNEMGEIKQAMEKAKNFHYKEIVISLREILDKVKIIKFHQDKIYILSDEKNLSQQGLKRFSYVQRQVNNFSRSEGNLTTVGVSDKREKRRVASEISVEYLDTWEKFLDSNKGEAEILQKEEKRLPTEAIPKRTTNSIRRKKKFVSSTLDGFLDRDFRCSSLDSIIEELSDSETNLERGCSTPNLCNYKDFIENRPWLNKEIGGLPDGNKIIVKGNSEKVGDKEAYDIQSEKSKTVEAVCSEHKPRIVDIVYKKKPT